MPGGDVVAEGHRVLSDLLLRSSWPGLPISNGAAGQVLCGRRPQGFIIDTPADFVIVAG